MALFKKKPKPHEKPAWLIVGLGNPGAQYAMTRHNIGFEVIDALAEIHQIKLNQSKHQARFGIGRIEDEWVALVKPMTFMNLSGRAVAPMAREWEIPPERILVVADETDLAPWRLRLRSQGGAGGHNGHKSLIQLLGTNAYPRLRIGIGRVDKEDTVDHVLGQFTGEERVDALKTIQLAAKACETVIREGIERAMQSVNTGSESDPPTLG